MLCLSPRPLILSLLLLAGCQTADEKSSSSQNVQQDKGVVADTSADMKGRIAGVLQAIDGEDPVETREALRTLSMLGSRAVPPILEWLKGDVSEKAKMRVVQLLGKMGLNAASAVSTLEDLKLFGEGNVKAVAARALADIARFEECGFSDLPEGTKLYAYGSYASKHTLEEIQLGDSGHAVSQVDIAVSDTEKPVVLILAAYDPVVWRIGKVPEAKIEGIYISGYHTQALIGVADSTPYRIVSSEQTSADCPRIGYEIQERQAEQERLIAALTGIEDYTVLTKVANDTLFAGPIEHDQSKIVYEDALSLDRYARKGAIPAGKKGIEHLVQEGKLRKATKEDIEEVVRLLVARGIITPEQTKQMSSRTMYVVLEETEYPTGLFGAHSEAFIIPKGIPKPKGKPGHSIVYNMEELTNKAE